MGKESDRSKERKLVEEIRRFARTQAMKASAGAQTHRYAAVMTKHYGDGVADAAARFWELPQAPDAILEAIEKETRKIDPKVFEEAVAMGQAKISGRRRIKA